MLLYYHTNNQAFIDIRLRPGIATPPEEDRGGPQGICITNFAKIGPGVPEICSRTDKHTDAQTEKLIAILRCPTGAE